LFKAGNPSKGANGVIFGGSFSMPSVLRWFPRWCKKILLGESATKLNEIADVLVRQSRCQHHRKRESQHHVSG